MKGDSDSLPQPDHPRHSATSAGYAKRAEVSPVRRRLEADEQQRQRHIFDEVRMAPDPAPKRLMPTVAVVHRELCPAHGHPDGKNEKEYAETASIEGGQNGGFMKAPSYQAATAFQPATLRRLAGGNTAREIIVGEHELAGIVTHGRDSQGNPRRPVRCDLLGPARLPVAEEQHAHQLRSCFIDLKTDPWGLARRSIVPSREKTSPRLCPPEPRLLTDRRCLARR